MKLYHGTDLTSKIQITKNGFKKNFCSDFGEAVYFSNRESMARNYTFDDSVIHAEFDGTILDLQDNNHFDIYKKCTNGIIPPEFDALKDGDIIAVFNLKTIKIIEP